MRLNYLIIDPKELTAAEKVYLSCVGKPFRFFLRRGVLLINKELPNPDALAKIAAAMWQYDNYLDEQGEVAFGALWDRAQEIAGADAAAQLSETWSESLNEKLEADNKRAASEWLNDELDAINAAAGPYNHGFIQALWNLTISTDAIFLYGYQKGMEAAGKGVRG